MIFINFLSINFLILFPLFCSFCLGSKRKTSPKGRKSPETPKKSKSLEQKTREVNGQPPRAPSLTRRGTRSIEQKTRESLNQSDIIEEEGGEGEPIIKSLIKIEKDQESEDEDQSKESEGRKEEEEGSTSFSTELDFLKVQEFLLHLGQTGSSLGSLLSDSTDVEMTDSTEDERDSSLFKEKDAQEKESRRDGKQDQKSKEKDKETEAETEAFKDKERDKESTDTLMIFTDNNSDDEISSLAPIPLRRTETYIVDSDILSFLESSSFVSKTEREDSQDGEKSK